MPARLHVAVNFPCAGIGLPPSSNKWNSLPFSESAHDAGHHMPFPGLGYVERTQDSFRRVPISYQLDL